MDYISPECRHKFRVYSQIIILSIIFSGVLQTARHVIQDAALKELIRRSAFKFEQGILNYIEVIGKDR